MNASLGSADHRLQHFIRSPPFVPDVELHQHTCLGRIHVTSDRLQDRWGIREHLEAASAHRGTASHRTPQSVHARCRGSVPRPIDFGQPVLNGCVSNSSVVGIQRLDAGCAATANPPLTNQQIEDAPPNGNAAINSNHASATPVAGRFMMTRTPSSKTINACMINVIVEG